MTSGNCNELRVEHPVFEDILHNLGGPGFRPYDSLMHKVHLQCTSVDLQIPNEGGLKIGNCALLN